MLSYTQQLIGVLSSFCRLFCLCVSWQILCSTQNVYLCLSNINRYGVFICVLGFDLSGCMIAYLFGSICVSPVEYSHSIGDRLDLTNQTSHPHRLLV